MTTAHIQDANNRRNFLKRGAAAAAAGVLGAGAAAGLPARAALSTASEQPPEKPAAVEQGPAPASDNLHRSRPPDAAAPFSEYSRYQPSFGGPVDSDHYLGKLVPGLRDPDLPPVPVETPDLATLPWKMVNGVKEFHLDCEPVTRELLPGNWMNFFGFNGTMPGPTIEAHQGDRVRLIVRNRLPEPTSIHWHGLELPIDNDGVPGVTQDPIPPGETYVYEFGLHQAGTFFYHPHMPMQETFGMVGYFIIHPAAAWRPAVDRDFLLIFQNFRIDPNQTISDSMAMDWSWHTINGRSGPYTTPLVCRLGERIRIRILDFSPMQHHPVHFHGHTFWVTGYEGARAPHTAWIPRNNQLIAVAQASDLEFIASNPGDWMLHCHMVHHMMNHMVEQVGPRIREDSDLSHYRTDLASRPRVRYPHHDRRFLVPGYPQMMQGMSMSDDALKKINGRRETRGMRHHWHKGVKGLMTVVRVLPDDLYDLVMNRDEEVEPGQVFEEIMRRHREDPRPGVDPGGGPSEP